MSVICCRYVVNFLFNDSLTDRSNVIMHWSVTVWQ